MIEFQRLLDHGLQQTEGRDDSNASLTLVYVTAEWVDALDAVVCPRLEALVEQINSAPAGKRVRLRILRHDASSSTDFQQFCKHFGIISLPCCILLENTNGELQEVLEDVFKHHQAVDNCETKSEIPSYTELNVAFHICIDTTDEQLSTMLDRRSSSLLTLRSWYTINQSNPALPLASVFDPTLIKMRENATELFEKGDFLAAAKQFVQVLLRYPECSKSNFNLAVILQTIGETYFAIAFMFAVIAIDDNDSVAHTVIRSVYYQDEPDRVVSGYLDIIERYPHHFRAVHSLATLRGEATTAAPAYVKQVFDELADTFEDKLVTHLEYRVPWQLVDALQKQAPDALAPLVTDDSTVEKKNENCWRVADVGCGTGLCGRLLRPFVAYIVGVDISPLMIEKARETGAYDDLQIDEITPFLQNCEDQSLDLIISADVWIYVGKLDRIFALCSQKLKSQGWLAFSIECLPFQSVVDNDGYRLAPSGRFQHSEAYISTLADAHGFVIHVNNPIDVRKESGEPIPGRIYLLQRA